MILEINNSFFNIQYTEDLNKKELYDYSIKTNDLNKILQEKLSLTLEEQAEQNTKDSHSHIYAISSMTFDGEISPETWVSLKNFLKENIDNLSLNFVSSNLSTYKYQLIIEVQKII